MAKKKAAHPKLKLVGICARPKPMKLKRGDRVQSACIVTTVARVTKRDFVTASGMQYPLTSPVWKKI